MSTSKGGNLTKPHPEIDICFLSSLQSRFPRVWIQKANWVENSSWEASPQLTYPGTSSLLFYYFSSRWISLLQFQDNQFIFLRLLHPNWITHINSRVLAPVAGMRSQAVLASLGPWAGSGCLFIFSWSSECWNDFHRLYTQPSQSPLCSQVAEDKSLGFSLVVVTERWFSQHHPAVVGLFI